MTGVHCEYEVSSVAYKKADLTLNCITIGKLVNHKAGIAVWFNVVSHCNSGVVGSAWVTGELELIVAIEPSMQIDVSQEKPTFGMWENIVTEKHIKPTDVAKKMSSSHVGSMVKEGDTDGLETMYDEMLDFMPNTYTGSQLHNLKSIAEAAQIDLVGGNFLTFSFNDEREDERWGVWE